MRKRFTDKELYEIRNYIPINMIIEHLEVPSKISEGYFRFLCPICNEFQTSTKKETNLARCYGCEKNFNTIDMVKTVTSMDFVNSVKFLKQFLPKSDPTTFTAPSKGFVSIGDIIKIHKG